MNRLDRAREIVRQYPLPPALRDYGAECVGSYAREGARLSYYDGTATRYLVGEVTADVLARSLQYMVTFDRTDVADESAVPLGTSKYNGLPHLPPGFEWPAGQYFAVQLNLTEFHPYDVHDVFPDHGMIYIFVSVSTLDVTVVHHAGPVDELRVTPYPDPSTIPDAKYYLRTFLEQSAQLRFAASGIFHLGDESELRDLVPSDLLDRVSSALGAPVTWYPRGFAMFGRPSYWQGEDETWDDDKVDEPKFLLFKDEVGDASVHVWISAADARKRDYSASWSDGSCT